MSNETFCPIVSNTEFGISINCIKKKCALYNHNTEACGIINFGININPLTEAIYELISAVKKGY